MALAPMLANGAVEQRRGNQLQHLAENAGYSIHGAPSGRGDSFVVELILTLAEERLFRGLAEGANLDTSDFREEVRSIQLPAYDFLVALALLYIIQ